ncbi:MAG: tetratricopeptide repeat protein [Minisyncoccia bacterium]
MDTTLTRNTTGRGFSFDAAAVWVLAVTIGFGAVAFIPSATIPFLYTKTSLFAVGAIASLALFIIARLTRGNIIVPPIPLVALLWVVPCAYALSALFSGIGIGRAFFGTEFETDTFGFIVLASLLATLAALVLRRRDHYRTFFRVSAVAFGLVLLSELGFIIAGQIMPDTVAATSNVIGSFADIGMLLGLGLSISLLALRFLPIGRRLRIVLWVAGAFELFVLSLVNSLPIWILVGLIALGLFIESVMRRRSSSADADLEGVVVMGIKEESTGEVPSHAIVPPLVVLVASLFFVMGGATIGSALSEALHAGVLDVRPSWQATFDIGGHTYASSPVFGTGPGTFAEQWLKFRDRSLNETVFWNLDFTSGIGYIPTSLVTIGALGAIAWVVFLGFFLFVGVRFLLVRTPNDQFLRFVSLASFVGAAYLFALSIVSVPGPLLIILAFVFVGVFASSLRHGKEASEWGVAFARSPRIGFLIVFVLTLLLLASVASIYVVVERYLASVSYARGVAALASGDVETAEEAAARSILFSPSDRAYRLQSTVAIARMNQIASDSSLTQDQARTQFQATLSQGVSHALTATQLGSSNYQNWAALGNVYASVVSLGIDGAYENAKTAYQHAKELTPSNPVLPYVVAQLEIAKKNGVGAEEALTEAISLKHNYTQAIFLLSQLEVQMGKAKEALQAAEAAAYFAPNDPTILFQVGLLRLGTGDADGAIAALGNATKLNPQYANAHFFLAVAYATKKDYSQAVAELQTVSALSEDNTQAVSGYITSLQAGKNPFPATTLTEAPVKEPVTSSAPGTTR